MAHNSASNTFRVFYNQTIYPELLHMEMRRQKLVRHIAFAAGMGVVLFAAALYIHILVLSLLIVLALGFWVAQLFFQAQVFLKEFKPRIITAILDFIDNDINYGTFSYVEDKLIEPRRFFGSMIFKGGHTYAGEDYIKGTIREMPIEMCELEVMEMSPVRHQMDKVFKGVFLIGDFKRVNMTGKILLIPDAKRKFMSRSERAFNLAGGKRVMDNLLPEFEKIFDTYATPDARIKTVLSEDMQRALLHYQARTQKHIYVSIIDDKIHLAVSQNKDLFEASLFRTNVSYEVVHEFYSDIQLLLSVVHDIDVMN